MYFVQVLKSRYNWSAAGEAMTFEDAMFIFDNIKIIDVRIVFIDLQTPGSKLTLISVK